MTLIAKNLVSLIAKDNTSHIQPCSSFSHYKNEDYLKMHAISKKKKKELRTSSKNWTALSVKSLI